MDKKKKLPAGKQPNRRVKTTIFVLLMVLLGWAYLGSSDLQDKKLQTVGISEVIERANKGEIGKIEVDGSKLFIYNKSDDKTPAQQSTMFEGSSLYEQGLKQDSKTVVTVKPQNNASSTWINIASAVLPAVFLMLFLVWMMRNAQGQGNQAMSFGRSSARLYGSEKEKVTFKDIAGSDEAKQDLEEVVEFLKTPKKFEGLGARIPKGVLLVGPPGTGKTMLARAVAGEAGAPFFSISGSEFVEMFVGVGASRVRDLFAKAKKNSPCIIFIDEIDAVGRRRGSGMGGGHDEREQTLNQILVEMDGFEQGQNVIVLAATNRADVLDPALLRPGRFDRRVNIGLPDRKDREAILKVHFAKKPLEKNVDLDALAAKSAGSSGADLANIANEAAIFAARHDRKTITQDDVTAAFEKVAIGPERKSKIMSEKEKVMTAYHEAGHAVVGHVLPDSDMVHKVTIISRGNTGGVTWFIPPEDKSYHSIVEYKDILARMLGGRIAEELIYGGDHVTTGAGSDLQKAAELAREMVVSQGMGKKLRNQVFHVDDAMVFDKMMHERQYSDETAKLIDDEVEALITEAADRAMQVLKANRKSLEALKNELLSKETIEAEEVEKILKTTSLPASAKLY
ncbi:ATP-dependent zinc metalloprotease FtsH [Candidatus Saccharibacteria bacterium]|jgi:cell division protease FtsH|nr:MAG: ATP-dependent zinc metalloprotease FtsH [Candidatus Saccharibacteria bacterium]